MVKSREYSYLLTHLNLFLPTFLIFIFDHRLSMLSFYLCYLKYKILISSLLIVVLLVIYLFNVVCLYVRYFKGTFMFPRWSETMLPYMPPLVHSHSCKMC